MTPEAVRKRGCAAPTEALYAWEERAAIMEFDGRLSRALAERMEQQRTAAAG